MPGIAHYEAIRKEIIRLLREEREHQQLSKYAVAQRSGVSESMVGLIERGLRSPSLEVVLRLADGIGANLPEIIKKTLATAKNTPPKKSSRKNG